VKIARFECNGKISYGIVNTNEIRAIKGDIFNSFDETEEIYDEVKIDKIGTLRNKVRSE